MVPPLPLYGCDNFTGTLEMQSNPSSVTANAALSMVWYRLKSESLHCTSAAYYDRAVKV